MEVVEDGDFGGVLEEAVVMVVVVVIREQMAAAVEIAETEKEEAKDLIVRQE